MRTMHLFAGIGGGLLADRILGHTPLVAVEWEPYACQVLRERVADGWFPGMHVWEGDVQLFDPSEYTGRVDCIHAGFPCQDISVAGKQVQVLREYNAHDVHATKASYHTSLPMIDFREQLTKKHGKDFLNHNDTKIGAEI